MQPPAFSQPPNYVIRREDREVANWNDRFTALRPVWLERVQNSRWMGQLSGGASLFTGGLTFACYFYMGGTPRLVINSVRGLGFATFVSGFASVYFFKKSCWQDPEYRIEQGRKAEEDIQINRLNMREIELKYTPYRTYDLLNNNDLNRLFRERIADEASSFQSTMDQIRCSSRFAFQLDEENKGVMKGKLVVHLETGSISKEDQTFLGFTDRDLDLYVSFPAFEKLKSLEISYEQFLQRVALPRWGVFSEENLGLIKGFALAHYVKENSGAVNILKRQDAIKLKFQMQELACLNAFDADLSRLQAGQISYGQYRERHSTESYLYLNDLTILRQAYCRSYKEMSQYPADASLLGLELGSLLQAQFELEIQGIQTLQELIEKMGTTVFTEMRLTKADPRLQRLVLKELTTYHVPTNSPLRVYDLMTTQVKKAVDDAMDQETRLVNSINRRKKESEATRDLEKELLKGLKETLATAQSEVEKRTAAHQRVEREISQKLSSIAESAAASQDLLRNRQDANALGYRGSIETLIGNQKRIELLLEEKTRLKKEVELASIKEKIAALKVSIEEKEEEIGKLRAQTVVGFAEASKTEGRAQKLEREKENLIAEKEKLAKQIEGVKSLSSAELSAAKAKLRVKDGLELELERATKALVEAKEANRLREDTQKKMEKIKQMPSQREIQQSLDLLYKEKSRLEEGIRAVQAQCDTIERELHSALKDIETIYQASLRSLDHELEEERRKIHAQFSAAIA